MVRFKAICALLAVLPAVWSRPFPFNSTGDFISEPELRLGINWDGLLFDWSQHDTAMGRNGGIQRNMPFNNPFLATSDDTGSSQILVTLGPCAGNTPHSHLRASENAFLLYGRITFAIVEENEDGNVLIARNMTQNTTFHVPKGLLHYSHNLECQPAAFIANFNNKDPGTQAYWPSMMAIPSAALNMVTGLSEAHIDAMKALPMNTAVAAGGEECLARCGIDRTGRPTASGPMAAAAPKSSVSAASAAASPTTAAQSPPVPDEASAAVAFTGPGW